VLQFVSLPARNLVERFFNKDQALSALATRYDKLAANDLASVQLASIRLWLRANESTSYIACRHGPFAAKATRLAAITRA
jgi:hypothetical protein